MPTSEDVARQGATALRELARLATMLADYLDTTEVPREGTPISPSSSPTTSFNEQSLVPTPYIGNREGQTYIDFGGRTWRFNSSSNLWEAQP